MKIAVIADSHDRVAPGLLEALAPAEEIWHLGDVTTRQTLAEFRALGRPLLLVRGNCDSEMAWPLTLEREVDGTRFHLVHIPPQPAAKGVEVVLHGHTHVPRNEVIGGVRFLNPGCLTRPNRGAPASFAWLETTKGEAWKWTRVLLSSLGAGGR